MALGSRSCSWGVEIKIFLKTQMTTTTSQAYYALYDIIRITITTITPWIKNNTWYNTIIITLIILIITLIITLTQQQCGRSKASKGLEELEDLLLGDVVGR